MATERAQDTCRSAKGRIPAAAFTEQWRGLFGAAASRPFILPRTVREVLGYGVVRSARNFLMNARDGAYGYESKCYDWGDRHGAKDWSCPVQHFTAIVWKAHRFVGCAAVNCADYCNDGSTAPGSPDCPMAHQGDVWVCNYAPDSDDGDAAVSTNTNTKMNTKMNKITDTTRTRVTNGAGGEAAAALVDAAADAAADAAVDAYNDNIIYHNDKSDLNDLNKRRGTFLLQFSEKRNAANVFPLLDPVPAECGFHGAGTG